MVFMWPIAAVARWGCGVTRQRRRSVSGARQTTTQLEFAFTSDGGNSAPPAAIDISLAPTIPTPIAIERLPDNREAIETPTTTPTKRGRDLRFWPGFMGRRAPSPPAGEAPMNTKRAAHHIRRSSRWMEAVRHEQNSPPWRKKGGLFEYYASQLDWWQEQLADTW